MVADEGKCPQVWIISTNILNIQRQTADKGWSASWLLVQILQKYWHVMEYYTET
jgi:hypothetical protein